VIDEISGHEKRLRGSLPPEFRRLEVCDIGSVHGPATALCASHFRQRA
jgi:hypothetical protein